MFKLQRLEIIGFKSFADHTELVFTGDGITAVVGPNGCGKSNVADAIAWVLGEQKIKNLRGGEMKDVIFQGSRNRPPSGMAEVVLHMVRDETALHEPDIEDIDSTLEEIDDQAILLEESIAPTLAGQSITGPEIVGPAIAEPSIDGPAIDALALPSPDLHAETASATSGNPPVAGDAVAVQAPDAAADGVAPATKAHHSKRHWRPSRRALEFAPGEAVSVTRRLYRSGESEYLLNGRLCRLRDIQDLFSGTGLSGAHYAIIEQGRIGQILSAKPMDRRTIVEEAAGITKFRVRQRAAEARLESARGNLSRISDIVSEIERQVGSLRRQAAKARKYRIMREELRELLRHVYVAEEHTLAALLEEMRARLDAAGREERALAEELDQREDDARHATQAARTLEDELGEARAAAAESALQRDRRLRERSYQEEQLNALGRRHAEVRNEIERLRERLSVVEEECEGLREQEAAERIASEETALLLQTAETRYARKVVEVTEAEAEIESARAELLTHTAVSERLMEIGRQLESALERLTLQAEGLEREGERAAALHKESAARAEALNAEIVVARARLDKLNAERALAVTAVVQGHEAVAETDAEYTRVRDEFARARHRLDTLKELDARHAHYSEAVQRIFNAGQDAQDFHFMGTLADKLQVESRWEHAIEGVFGSSLQSIIVPTPEDARRAAQWLRETDAGRASFLVAGLHGASDETDVATYRAESAKTTKETIDAKANAGQMMSGLAGSSEAQDDVRVGDLLGVPQELHAVLKRTLAQKMNARITGSLDQALAMSLSTGEMYVTMDGDWVAGGQLVSAGDGRALEEGAGLLAFKRELRELETSAQDLEAQLVVAEQAVLAARARASELEDAVVLLNEAIGREEREHLTSEMNAAQVAQEIERAERHMRVVADDAARLADERLELETRRATALTEAEAAEAARLSAVQQVSEATAMMTVARRAAETESESLGQQRAAAAAATERRRATSAELRRLEAERLDLEERLERHEQEVALASVRLEELGLSIGELERTALSVEEERGREEQAVAEVAGALAQARERADALCIELTELHQRAATARDARAAFEVHRAEATARLTYVREACMSELNQSLEELAREHQLEAGFDLEAGRGRVEELRARIEGFGAVNMMALEELSESEERLQFLTSQRQDITDGIASTEEALREIKRRSRERFRQAFAQINRNFGQFFQELFGGGRGEMSMIDADDVLESGIDIVAQPPGKRLQNVLLLSGGEKAMAALALVLGIFHYRPSPFCLLDEVDAPLDEANVGRFTDKIREMALSTQFIVITHNKRTMEMARALYGVTMQEPGISTLVSVKFE
ncbi:MAG TPA: chromosome segregation protein SMC [Pyrinomonadaceae bacterium]|jgi:chromosome segregation protein|nr:chromosome segregation protein SMC [Pyrinomonadaceae bacterium]